MAEGKVAADPVGKRVPIFSYVLAIPWSPILLLLNWEKEC